MGLAMKAFQLCWQKYIIKQSGVFCRLWLNIYNCPWYCTWAVSRYWFSLSISSYHSFVSGSAWICSKIMSFFSLSMQSSESLESWIISFCSCVFQIGAIKTVALIPSEDSILITSRHFFSQYNQLLEIKCLICSCRSFITSPLLLLSPFSRVQLCATP